MDSNVTWNTQEIFQSEPEPICSSPQTMEPTPLLTSSPHHTPSPQKKRKSTGDLELGTTQLARSLKAQRVCYGNNIHESLEGTQLQEGMPKPAANLDEESARTRVFDITELREIIFSSLALTELLLIQRVCEQWRTFVQISPVVQKRLFFRPSTEVRLKFNFDGGRRKY